MPIPFTFATAAGNVPASQLDFNFAYLEALIADQNASQVAFNDTIGLGANNLQQAIIALFNLIGSGGGGGSSPKLDFSQSTDSQYSQIAQGD